MANPLIESELTALIEATQFSCATWLAQEQKWRLSPGLCAAIGLRPEWVEWDQKTIALRVHPDESAQFSDGLSRFIDSGQAIAKSFQIRHENGSWRWFFCKSAVQDDYRFLTFQDETEAREERAAMIDSQMRLRSFHDAAPIAIIVWSREGRITEWNHMAETVFGYNRTAAIGSKLVPWLVVPSDQEAFSRTVSSAVKENAVSQYSCRSVTGKGDSIICHWRTVALRGPTGGLSGLLSLAMDITAAEAAAEALKHARDHAVSLNQAKTEFMAMIGHELRTPLNGVLGVAQILEISVGESELEFVKLIRSSGEMLLGVINGIIDYTAIDIRPLEDSLEEMSPAECLALLADACTWKAKKKGVDLELSIDDELWQPVMGDRLSLEKIMSALLDNAVKFTNAGSVIASLSTISTDSATKLVRCSIKDTGCGIAAANLQSIFVPFKQESDVHQRVHGGVGLGLALASKLIERLDGTISVNSVQGQGSEFVFEVPFRLLPPAARQ
jgi:PAS domain S-box-containing protein